MSLPLAGKVAIVTGSAKGIGASIVKRFAADGANVVINYASSSAVAEELAASINAQGAGRAVAIQADVSTVAGGKHLLEEGLKAFGKLDILVFNAGLMKTDVLATITDEDFDRHFDMNVKVPLFVTQAALPYLKPGTITISYMIRSRLLTSFTIQEGA